MSEQKPNKGLPVFDESKMVDFSGVQISAVNDKLTLDKINQIANSYNPEYRKAPLTITHEKTGKLKTWAALGWIKKVWTDGKKLMADFSMHPALLQTLKEGLTRTWSIGTFWDDVKKTMYLDHLAFLGAELPYVPDMPDLTYSIDIDMEKFEFSSDINWEKKESIDFELPKKEKKEKKLKEDVTYTKSQVDDLTDAAVNKAELKFKSDHEMELSDIKLKLDTANSEIKKLEKEKQDLEKKVLEFSEKAMKAEVDNDVSALVNDAKIEPSQKEKISNILFNLKKSNEEDYKTQIEIYNSYSKMNFGAESGMNVENSDGELKRFSMTDGIIGGGN